MPSQLDGFFRLTKDCLCEMPRLIICWSCWTIAFSRWFPTKALSLWDCEIIAGLSRPTKANFTEFLWMRSTDSTGGVGYASSLFIKKLAFDIIVNNHYLMFSLIQFLYYRKFNRRNLVMVTIINDYRWKKFKYKQIN